MTTDAVSTSTLTYALKDAPAGMTISTSGLVQWTPGSEEDIKNHSSIKLQISSSNGSLKEQVFSVGVEGSCSREFRLWEGDQRSSVNASKELSSLYVYSDSASNPKNPVQNYNYGGSARHSANITHGKQPVEDKGVFFLYQEHDKTDRFYLFMILNKRGGTDSTSDGGVGGLKLKWDLFVSGNELQDSVQVSDDSGEVERSNVILPNIQCKADLATTTPNLMEESLPFLETTSKFGVIGVDDRCEALSIGERARAQRRGFHG